MEEHPLLHGRQFINDFDVFFHGPNTGQLLFLKNDNRQMTNH